MASRPTQLLLGRQKHCNARHLIHHLTVRYPKCARILSGQMGSTALPQQSSEPASQPLTASSFTFAFTSFTFCAAGLLPGQTAESAASAAAQLRVTHVRGAAWGQERPLGQQQPTKGCNVRLHLCPAAPQSPSSEHPQGKREPSAGEHRCRELGLSLNGS